MFMLRVGLFLAIFIAAVVVGWRLLEHRELPVFHPKQLDPRLVDPAVRNDPAPHKVSDFLLTDQLGRQVSAAGVAGKVRVVDFFFTTCATICPKMTGQMARVQEAFRRDDRVLLLSHSVTPEMDSVEVLAAYAELHDVDPGRWLLLTGDRAQIYSLARRSYFAALDQGDGGPDDFVHTENFVLVDPEGRIRGFYDGTSKGDVDRLIADIGLLLKSLP
ncbi:MAG: SCO family protein [Flavobacteriales bacterium]|nr:SCO family protein [Flavobacteriales bacterium]